MWKIHEKKYEDLKSFKDWLTWKQEDRAFDKKWVVWFVLIVGVLFAYLVGFSQGLTAEGNNPYAVACSALKMEHVHEMYDDFCIDSQGNWNRVVINEGKVFIEGQ